MFYSLVNKVIRFNLKKYMEELMHSSHEPFVAQRAVMSALLQQAKNTEFGKAYGFDTIHDFNTFSKRIPLATYGDLKGSIERMRSGESNVLWPGQVKWYAKSSGTTSGKSKYIPVSQDSINSCHFAGGRYELAMYFNHRPESKLFEGLGLRLGGSTVLEQHGLSKSGDLSAILIQNIPTWAEFRSAPSPNTALMTEWEEKIEAILDEVIDQNITSFWGVSSWFLVLFNKVLERTGKNNLLEVWPNLELFAHGGVNFVPYENQFRQLMPGNQVTFMENYNASEGFFAIQDNPSQEGMLLLLDSGIYYEFIPMSDFYGTESDTIPLEKVDIGKEYAIVITTNGGLWRYILGDTVKFLSTQPHRIKLSGRTAHFINAFGEELIVSNAEEALQNACEMHQCSVRDFHAGPIFMEDASCGAHQWIIEFEKVPYDLKAFTHSLDLSIQNLNSDYGAKRKSGLVLGPLELIIARDSLFHDWLKLKGKLGGQNKIPRLSNNRLFLEQFMELNRSPDVPL